MAAAARGAKLWPARPRGPGTPGGTSGNKGRYGNGKCTSGSGEYHLHGRCNIPWAPDPYFTTDWVRVGQAATGDCRDLGVDYTAHDLYLVFR